jgi:hypothetical protein
VLLRMQLFWACRSFYHKTFINAILQNIKISHKNSSAHMNCKKNVDFPAFPVQFFKVYQLTVRITHLSHYSISKKLLKNNSYQVSSDCEVFKCLICLNFVRNVRMTNFLQSRCCTQNAKYGMNILPGRKSPGIDSKIETLTNSRPLVFVFVSTSKEN